MIRRHLAAPVAARLRTMPVVAILGDHAQDPGLIAGRRRRQYSSSTQRLPAISSALRRAHRVGLPSTLANTLSS